MTGLTTARRTTSDCSPSTQAGSSPASNVVTTDPSSTVVSAPRALSWSDYEYDEGYIRLSWLPPVSDGGLPVSYVVQRSDDGTTGWVTSWETDETTDVDYYRPSYWRVLAVNEAGSSPPSNVVHVPLRVASAPRLSTLDPVNGSGQVQLSWLPPANDFGSDDHRLRHRAVTERDVRLGQHRRRNRYSYELHRDGSDERHEVLLPSVRRQRGWHRRRPPTVVTTGPANSPGAPER